jgi:ADP-ribose pyrophosphatase
MPLKKIRILRDRTSEARCDEGFFTLRRLVLENHYCDGSRSRPYDCDLLERRGVDAVAVALHGPSPTGRIGDVPVVLRRGIRPAVYFRRQRTLPRPDSRTYTSLLEVVAGIVEPEDMGEAGIRRRAAIESYEEAGFRIAEDAVRLLGQGAFTAPGIMAERLYYAAALVDLDEGEQPRGDGSSFEEQGEIEIIPLGEALRMCLAGEIEDAKTEICLRRLKHELEQDNP